MKLATWNIYWLGERTGDHIVRTEEDEALIAQVVARIKPDVLAIQEVVDPLALERVLEKAKAPGQEYTIRGGDGTWLTSDRAPDSETNNWQKTFLCLNESTIEFVSGGAIKGAAGRRPYAAELRHRDSGRAFTAVAVHFQSGWPAFLGEDDANKRRDQAEALTRWLQGEAAESNGPPGIMRARTAAGRTAGGRRGAIREPTRTRSEQEPRAESRSIWNGSSGKSAGTMSKKPLWKGIREAERPGWKRRQGPPAGPGRRFAGLRNRRLNRGRGITFSSEAPGRARPRRLKNVPAKAPPWERSSAAWPRSSLETPRKKAAAHPRNQRVPTRQAAVRRKAPAMTAAPRAAPLRRKKARLLL